MGQQNYTLGRGKIYFSRFAPGTQNPLGFRYIGNTPEFSMTIESENLDHFSSDEGIKEKDDSVPLQVTRTGQFSTDNIDPENVALFFFGEASKLTQASIASAPETLSDVVPGMFYQLGVSASNPVGYRGIDTVGFLVKKGATSFVEGTDFTMNYETGMLEVIAGGAIIDGDEIVVTYAVKASTRDRVISGSTPTEGAMRFIAANPKGKDFDYILPWVKITPNGDYALKGEEWQTIPFNLEALKPSASEAIYCDGRPAFA
jgi:hypothetical protein